MISVINSVVSLNATQEAFMFRNESGLLGISPYTVHTD